MKTILSFGRAVARAARIPLLVSLAAALGGIAAHAQPAGPPPNEAPVIIVAPDVILGDLEQGDAANIFVFPDAIDLDDLIVDDNTADDAIKWSYLSSDTTITLNGAPQLSTVDPNAPGPGENLRAVDADNVLPGQDALPQTVTIRNEGLSPFGSGGGLGPYAEPSASGVLPSLIRTLTLFASDGSTYSQFNIVVYTANSTSDSLSFSVAETWLDLDFENDPSASSGWFGGVLGGLGATSIATGLCMSVPFGSDPGSILGWLSPPNFLSPGPNLIPLIDNAVYRCTLTLWTDTTADSAIPYIDFVWSNVVQNANFPLPGGVDGNTFGGSYWLLDVAGGATGIGRYQTDFNLWIAPNAVQTPQWRGVIDPVNSAFDPSVDFKNDIALTFRMIHDNTALNTAADGGTVCLRRIRVDRLNIDSMSLTPIQTAPIQSFDSGGIFFSSPVDSFGGCPFFSSLPVCPAVIDNDNHRWDVSLTSDPSPSPSAPLATVVASRARLLYQDLTQPEGYRRFFPLLWERGKLYMSRAMIRSNIGGPTGSIPGTDPVDMILLDFDVPQSEFGAFHFTTKGSVNNFLHAASPRPAALQHPAAPQPYIAFFEGTEPSKAAAIGASYADSDRLRATVDIFNTGNIIGTISDGLDPLTVESVEVFEATFPGQ